MLVATHISRTTRKDSKLTVVPTPTNRSPRKSLDKNRLFGPECIIRDSSKKKHVKKKGIITTQGIQQIESDAWRAVFRTSKHCRTPEDMRILHRIDDRSLCM